jgi:hypothetical protein
LDVGLRRGTLGGLSDVAIRRCPDGVALAPAQDCEELRFETGEEATPMRPSRKREDIRTLHLRYSKSVLR